MIRGYNLSVDDDLQAVRMENAADVHVELVELVNGPRRPNVPQHTIIQHQVIGGVEGGTVSLVVVCQGGVVQGQDLLTRLDVVNLQHTTTNNIKILIFTGSFRSMASDLTAKEGERKSMKYF